MFAVCLPEPLLQSMAIALLLQSMATARTFVSIICLPTKLLHTIKHVFVASVQNVISNMDNENDNDHARLP